MAVRGGQHRVHMVTPISVNKSTGSLTFLDEQVVNLQSHASDSQSPKSVPLCTSAKRQPKPEGCLVPGALGRVGGLRQSLVAFEVSPKLGYVLTRRFASFLLLHLASLLSLLFDAEYRFWS